MTEQLLPRQTESDSAVEQLPPGWSSNHPGTADVAELHALLAAHELAARGSSSAALASVDSEVAGPGALTRRHRVLRDVDSRLRAWATVHDRAAGRALVAVTVDPDLEPAVADDVAALLLAWSTEQVAILGAERGLPTSQVDSGAFAADLRQQRWLAAAGLKQVRQWWQMSRPVASDEAPPEPGPDIVLRTVARDPDTGKPVRSDLKAVHEIMESAFTDHFNYHEESLDEWISRMREDPGHRWNHWWIAELIPDGGGPAEPAGALVSAASYGEDGEPDGTYVEYLGVLRSARGRGVAKLLLQAVFADTAERGRPTVGIEVDESSSTGAGALYLSMGFVTNYVTQSWHLDVPASPAT